MKQLSRDAWLAMGLVLVLLVITMAAVAQQTQKQTAPPLASFSSAPDGTHALWLWLDELGYAVSDELFGVFRPPAETGLMLILEPTQPITPDEWQRIDAWVEKGGMLVLAGDGLITSLAARHYQFNLSYLEPQTATLTAQTPLWLSPPANPASRVRLQAYFQTKRADFVTHLAVEAGPVLLSFEQGDGQVTLSAVPFLFSNAGLKEAGNPALVLNVVTAAGEPGVVWFDEWHHGIRSNRAEVIGPGNWLRYTPAGHSLLYLAAVVFVALALHGRRFGRPLPLPREIGRRPPLEHITAIANLNRRAGHRMAVLRQYHHWLKRGLGQRYRLNPTLPDDDYLAQLAHFNPNLDRAALANLLARLGQANVGESEMIQLAAETAEWLKESS